MGHVTTLEVPGKRNSAAAQLLVALQGTTIVRRSIDRRDEFGQELDKRLPMGSIDKRVGKKGVTWRARVTIKGHPVEIETFKRKADADAWVATTEAALRSGKHLPSRQARARTVGDLFARYRLDVLPSYTRRERAQRSGKLGWWEAQLGALLVADLTTAKIIECRAKLARGEGISKKPLGPGTQVRYLAVLKHVLAKAKDEWEWINDDPAARARGPKEPRGRVRYLSGEERKALLAACRESKERRLYPLVVVALGTGARQGELLGLRWPDVDLVRRQGHRPRSRRMTSAERSRWKAP